MLYVALKFLHVIAVILWIGPPLGAYYFLARAYQTRDAERIVWAERVAERVLVFEHAALVILIATGLYIVWMSSGALLAVPWFQKKMWFFGGVMVFEAFDIWFAHRIVKRLLDQDVPLTAPEWKRAERIRRWLIIAAIPVGGLMIPAILYFAVSKL